MKVAIVGGLRTPFVKAGGKFSKFSALSLSENFFPKLLESAGLREDDVHEFVFGSVLHDPRVPNIARETVLRASKNKTMNAHAVSNNCITGLVAIYTVANAIKSKTIDVGIAGGVECMTNPALTLRKDAEDFFRSLARAKSSKDKLKLLPSFRPSFVLPQPPSPKEPSTGLTMGQHCELMVKEFDILREEQDALAYESHSKASKAWNEGFYTNLVCPMPEADKDDVVRPSTTLEKLATLPPVFDRSERGTLTAGNSSALTDGASGVVLMSLEAVERHSKISIGYVEDIVFTSVQPRDGLLMAPARGLPLLLSRNNLKVSDIDLFEIHEAFAGQVLCTLKAWEKGWNKYPECQNPIGEIPREKINIVGGSLALGHPFAATGARMVLSCATLLKQKNLKRGIISICAAGGMGAVALVTT
jgi:acetyl-CoA acetyltransferase family protein